MPLGSEFVAHRNTRILWRDFVVENDIRVRATLTKVLTPHAAHLEAAARIEHRL